MNLDTATELLKALGTTLDTHSSSWARAKCPLAPFTHQKKKDSNPSFGLTLGDGGNRFHCFSCETGTLSTLLQLIEFRNQQQPGHFFGDLAKAREIIEMAESELPMLPTYSEFGEQKKKVFEELPPISSEKFVPVFDNQRAIDYCLQRSILAQEVVSYDLRYDKERDMLASVYYNVFGKLAGIRGRKINLHGDAIGPVVQHHDYVFNGINNASLVLYNEQSLNLPGPVVLVEGQIDCIKVCRVWPKTVANLTAKPIITKVNKLEHSEGVVLLLDGDKTGREATEKWIHLLDYMGIKCLPLYLPWDEATGVKSDPDSVGTEFLTKMFKDAGLLDD